MSFASVYRLLQEIFPEVDFRLLRAVAVENPNNPDVAVEEVLNMGLPFTSSVYLPGSTSNQVDNQQSGNSPVQTPLSDNVNSKHVLTGERVAAEQSVSLQHQGLDEETKTCSPSDQGSVESEVAILDEIQSGVSAATMSALAGESLDYSDATGNQNTDVTVESDEVFDGSNSSAINGDLNLNLNCPPKEGQKLDNEEIAPFADSAANSEFSNSEFEKLESSGLLESSSERVFCDTENDDSLENSSSTTIVSKSGQTCSIDLLENAIEDAKSNKKNLFAAMETVINMMKEAELQEEKAELSKKEASLGGLDTLERVEDLRQMLQRAREANDMHAGEVYGEKSILATEMRELQSRLINLSDERDESLSILDEMNRTLEARLVAAEEMRIAADKEKQERENSARELLAEQELIMEKVVQESKKLQQQADENSKLRDFLMDRGRVVDVLQGEIAVICKDVKLLKEKFDECVPFSKSVSSSQTSCILASSGSFSKSLVADWVPEHDLSSETPKKITPASSISSASLVSSVCEDHPLLNTTSPENEDTKFDGKKSLSDDDWDMFEDETPVFP
ncbi:hypothetical protein C5167_012077 [Papaver somniferum]|uniref:CUE domain-containing protein n=1 Tax=Papaver somniferum TaxID=3469 RepID=A0A4Y7IWF5_PAPSO|nr:putative leucine-rich repeat-containing protein DDB_G0290503 [Papaver somniferum]RZC53223.1 hypothetical protein C5167_012077 [Papaver somniferum]